MSKPSKSIKRSARALQSNRSLKAIARSEARNGNPYFAAWLQRKGCKV